MIMNPDIIDFSRMLRRKETEAEKYLWNYLRDRRLQGEKFYRQFPIEVSWQGKDTFFVVDFIHRKTGLVIEIDGSVHIKQREYDELREHILEGKGYQIIRFTNSEVFKKRDEVLIRIKKKIDEVRDLTPARRRAFPSPKGRADVSE